MLLLDNARHFYAAWLILDEHNDKLRQDQLASQTSGNTIPNYAKIGFAFVADITCLAFALELYFKAAILHSTGTSPPHKHDFRQLFDSLSTLDRDTIFQEWRNHFTGTTTINVFNDLLDRDSLAFQEWRYAHETVQSKQIKFATSHAEALVKALEIFINGNLDGFPTHKNLA